MQKNPAIKIRNSILKHFKNKVIVQCPNCKVELLRSSPQSERCNVCEKDVKMKLLK